MSNAQNQSNPAQNLTSILSLATNPNFSHIFEEVKSEAVNFFMYTLHKYRLSSTRLIDEQNKINQINQQLESILNSDVESFTGIMKKYQLESSNALHIEFIEACNQELYAAFLKSEDYKKTSIEYKQKLVDLWDHYNITDEMFDYLNGDQEYNYEPDVIEQQQQQQYDDEDINYSDITQDNEQQNFSFNRDLVQAREEYDINEHFICAERQEQQQQDAERQQQQQDAEDDEEQQQQQQLFIQDDDNEEELQDIDYNEINMKRYNNQMKDNVRFQEYEFPEESYNSPQGGVSQNYVKAYTYKRVKLDSPFNSSCDDALIKEHEEFIEQQEQHDRAIEQQLSPVLEEDISQPNQAEFIGINDEYQYAENLAAVENENIVEQINYQLELLQQQQQIEIKMKNMQHYQSQQQLFKTNEIIYDTVSRKLMEQQLLNKSLYKSMRHPQSEIMNAVLSAQQSIIKHEVDQDIKGVELFTVSPQLLDAFDADILMMNKFKPISYRYVMFSKYSIGNQGAYAYNIWLKDGYANMKSCDQQWNVQFNFKLNLLTEKVVVANYQAQQFVDHEECNQYDNYRIIGYIVDHISNNYESYIGGFKQFYIQ